MWGCIEQVYNDDTGEDIKLLAEAEGVMAGECECGAAEPATLASTTTLTLDNNTPTIRIECREYEEVNIKNPMKLNGISRRKSTPKNIKRP